MSIFDFFKAKEYKTELEKIKNEYNKLKSTQLSVEKMDALELQKFVDEKNKEINELNKVVTDLHKNIDDIKCEIRDKNTELNELKNQLIDVSEVVELESFGIYTPKYNLTSSDQYKTKLEVIRNKQKSMIQSKKAVLFFDGWTVDGSKEKGKKMNDNNIKLILRSFNNECEAAINKVKFNNIDKIEKRIFKSFEQLNKLNKAVRISLRREYLDLKIQELYLVYEYERKKEEEKEELREQKRREKEEKALLKEIEQKKKIIDKDIKHYEIMIEELREKLKLLTDKEEKDILSKQLLELHEKVEEKQEEKDELDYRTANASAGYVYIISNIGAFGNDVFKIGVTRRLDPLERIAELSSASVPFKFDVHALIFSYDAYKLENELHNYFDKYRVNKVNNRKEFFKVPIDEIELKLNEYKDLTIEFTKEADAEEYKQSSKV